jgi:hypothetical protein
VFLITHYSSPLLVKHTLFPRGKGENPHAYSNIILFFIIIIIITLTITTLKADA